MRNTQLTQCWLCRRPVTLALVHALGATVVTCDDCALAVHEDVVLERDGVRWSGTWLPPGRASR